MIDLLLNAYYQTKFVPLNCMESKQIYD